MFDQVEIEALRRALDRYLNRMTGVKHEFSVHTWGLCMDECGCTRITWKLVYDELHDVCFLSRTRHIISEAMRRVLTRLENQKLLQEHP
jgi:hypothetical protein